uniref:Protein kinase domain-containing protein n=1 Tax=Aegilops tauschii TaxID=37682 RepID=M8C6D5_AEGTA
MTLAWCPCWHAVGSSGPSRRLAGKHIRALMGRGHGPAKPNEASIPEGGEPKLGMDKGFSFCKHFFGKYELGEEASCIHFGYTYAAKAKKGEHKGQDVAVKVIPKAKLHTLHFYTSFSTRDWVSGMSV